jgi:hypothetical protein
LSDPVNSPDHYRRGGFELANVIDAFELNWRLASVAQYVFRAGRKGDRLQDLRKALWYLQREITLCESSAPTATFDQRHSAPVAKVLEDNPDCYDKGKTFCDDSVVQPGDCSTAEGLSLPWEAEVCSSCRAYYNL